MMFAARSGRVSRGPPESSEEDEVVEVVRWAISSGFLSRPMARRANMRE
jgi:hypothetical protein